MIFGLVGLGGHAAIAEAAEVCGGYVARLALELEPGDVVQRFGPHIYTLRSIYRQIAETRPMIDIPRLVDWADGVIARIDWEMTGVGGGGWR